jgi:hypothetical protein
MPLRPLRIVHVVIEEVGRSRDPGAEPGPREEFIVPECLGLEIVGLGNVEAERRAARVISFLDQQPGAHGGREVVGQRQLGEPGMESPVELERNAVVRSGQGAGAILPVLLIANAGGDDRARQDRRVELAEQSAAVLRVVEAAERADQRQIDELAQREMRGGRSTDGVNWPVAAPIDDCFGRPVAALYPGLPVARISEALRQAVAGSQGDVGGELARFVPHRRGDRVDVDPERSVKTACVAPLVKRRGHGDDLRRLALQVRISQRQVRIGKRGRLDQQLRPDLAVHVVVGLGADDAIGDPARGAAVSEVSGEAERGFVTRDRPGSDN